jgi:hypothetical protein
MSASPLIISATASARPPTARASRIIVDAQLPATAFATPDAPDRNGYGDHQWSKVDGMFPRSVGASVDEADFVQSPDRLQKR